MQAVDVTALRPPLMTLLGGTAALRVAAVRTVACLAAARAFVAAAVA